MDNILNYLHHIFSSSFIVLFGVLGIWVFTLYDSLKHKKYKWFFALLFLFIPLGFILVPLYIIFSDNPDKRRAFTEEDDKES